jgi:phosphatidylglycerophosphate synthase
MIQEAAMTRQFVAALTRWGLRPNQLSWLGLILVVISCLLYLWHRSSLWLGVGLAISFSFDALDGALARAQGTVSKFGGYLDAVVDRYQEVIAFLVIAGVTGWWVVSFLAVTGSLLTSYNKARVAVEMPVDNKGWPDLLERPQRVVLLIGGLVLDSAIPLPQLLGGRFLYLILGVLAVGTHVTAIQRFLRARRMLEGTPP